MPARPPTPLVMPECVGAVLTPGRAEVKDLREEAERQLALAQASNLSADRCVLYTVLLASVLFFTGIAGQFDPGRVRAALVSLAGIALAVVIGVLIASPLAPG